MINIFFPSNNDKNEIFIASSSKGQNIKASEITEEKRKEIEIDFFNKINLDMKKAIFMHQVHKDNIVKIDETNKNIYSKENPVKETDALITNLKNVPLVIQTADCLPIILYCKESKSMAAIHCSWRGIVQKIVPKTIELMKKEYNIDARTTYGYIGAHIFQKDYEVGEEVAIHFRAKRIINGKWGDKIVKLMEAVDEWIPTPERATDQPFLMPDLTFPTPYYSNACRSHSNQPSNQTSLPVHSLL